MIGTATWFREVPLYVAIGSSQVALGVYETIQPGTEFFFAASFVLLGIGSFAAGRWKVAENRLRSMARADAE